MVFGHIGQKFIWMRTLFENGFQAPTQKAVHFEVISLAVFGEKPRYCHSLGIVVVVMVVQNLDILSYCCHKGT